MGDMSVVGEAARARVVLARTGVCMARYFGGVDAPEPGPDLREKERMCDMFVL